MDDGPAAKRLRLDGPGSRAAPMPVGSNLIEVDGKTCTHEVAWPPGAWRPGLPTPDMHAARAGAASVGDDVHDG